MSVETTLKERSDSSCELCSATENLAAFEVAPSDGSAEQSILICSKCNEEINKANETDANHWRCLNDSMWSTEPAVQVMAFRLLSTIAKEGWPQDLLDMLYLEEDVKAWAESGVNDESDESNEPTRDANGAELLQGDTVTIIKDLEVKGAGFTAKRGTAVRNIALTNNPEQIEGRVNGTRIVLLTKFLKKS
jgi:protein PhnA